MLLDGSAHAGRGGQAGAGRACVRLLTGVRVERQGANYSASGSLPYQRPARVASSRSSPNNVRLGGDGGGGGRRARMVGSGILGELIRRVDGRDSQAFIQERITRSLGLEVHAGVAAEDFQRIAHFEYAAGRQGERYARELREIIVNRPGDVATLAFTNPSMSSKNTSAPRWWAYHQPGACSHATAHGLSGFYSALLGGRLIGAELLRDFHQEQSCGIDRTLCRPMRYGLGCMLENAADPAASYRMGQKAFGHVGLGGPVAFADPERNLSFAFVTTTMGGHVLMDPRPRALAERCYAAL